MIEFFMIISVIPLIAIILLIAYWSNKCFFDD